MSGKTRAFLLSLTIVALLVVSAVGTTTVYADDGTSTGTTETDTTTTGTDQDDTSTTDTEQPTDTTTTGTDQGDTSTTGDEQPTDTTTDTTTTTSTDQSVTSTPGEEQPPAEEVTTPLLEQLPDNTTVAVVDAAGEAQPLVAQDSADAVLLSDPIWCPANQAPTPETNGCTKSYSSFTELLDFLQANEGDAAYQQAGTIYVQQGAYLGGESSIDFNSYNFTNLNQHNLTVHGGWDITDNSTTGTSQFEVPISIGSSSNPWVGSLTFNNIFIDGVGDQTGLTLYSQGNINLSNVEVTNSLNGADLNAGGDVTVDNSRFNQNKKSSAKITSGGNVKVTNSAFNNNSSGFIDDPTGSGVQINSGGKVTLLDVAANNNQLFGAIIEAGDIVSITQSFFNGNLSYATPSTGWEFYGYGLQVTTAQGIILDGVTAEQNFLSGANLDGGKVEISNSSFSDNKTTFPNESIGSGLKVKSSGNVTLLDVAANNNDLFGANIEAAGSVVVTQSFFNGNSSYEYVSNVKVYAGYGLQIVTPADIGLNNVTAEGNYLLGAHLEGSDVIVSNSSFSNNGSGSGRDLVGRGLEVVGITDPSFGTGDVSLFNVIADNNQLFGANIRSTGDVAIGGVSSFSGHLSYVYDSNTNKVASISGGYGLHVVSGGNIALRGVTTNNNYLNGTSLVGVDIAIADSFFSNNGSGVMTQPSGYGLKIVSSGQVALNTVQANGNQLFGADISAVGGVSILTGFFSRNQSVSFDPDEGLTFFGYGLKVYTTTGDITLNEVEGNFNNLWGGSLDGMTVDIANSQFNNNVSDSNIFIDDTGLLVNSRGDFVILNNVETLENRLIGADITAVGDVYITNSRFNDNRGITCSISWCPSGSQIYHGYGLKVTTPGLITLNGVTANDNNLFGAQLEGSTVSVTNSSFNNNAYGNGLTITATGDVTLTNVTASGNGDNGVEVNSGACVQVTGGTFTGNAQYGINVISGTLNLDGTQTFAGNGAGDFQGTPGTCVVMVVLSNSSLSNNTNSSTGNITISSSSTTNASISSNSTSDNKTIKHGKNKKHHKHERRHRGLRRGRGVRR